ncbi:MAG: glycosyltransferase family 2 protein, partial [Trebonia sp.]
FAAVVVDDGSTDETRSVAESTGDPRIQVLTVPNGGVSRARNHGIAATAGNFVAFLDADDMWQPEKLERQVAALRDDPDAGVCVTGAIRIDGESRELGLMPLWQPADVCAALLQHSMIVGSVSSGLVRRDVVERIGSFDPRFSQSADWDLWLRLAVATRFLILDQPLVRYRTAPGNMSSNIGLLERDTFAVLDAFFASPRAIPYRDLHARAYSAHWLVCAGSYLHAGSYAHAIRCLTKGLRAYPASLGHPLGFPARWLLRSLANIRHAR